MDENVFIIFTAVFKVKRIKVFPL